MEVKVEHKGRVMLAQLNPDDSLMFDGMAFINHDLPRVNDNIKVGSRHRIVKSAWRKFSCVKLIFMDD